MELFLTILTGIFVIAMFIRDAYLSHQLKKVEETLERYANVQLYPHRHEPTHPRLVTMEETIDTLQEEMRLLQHKVLILEIPERVAKHLSEKGVK